MKNGIATIGLIVMSIGASVEWWAHLKPTGADILMMLDGLMVAMLGALIVISSVIPSLLTQKRKSA